MSKGFLKQQEEVNKRVFLYPSGFAGMALYFHRLANALQKCGAKVTLFAYTNYELDDLPALYEKRKILSTGCLSFQHQQSKGLRFLRVMATRLWNFWLFCLAVIREQPEVAHIQELFYPLDWILFIFLNRSKSRSVLTVHDVLPHKFYTQRLQFLERKILGLIYRLADQLIVHSEMNRQQLLTCFPVCPKKVLVIPHGEYSLPEFQTNLGPKEAKQSLSLPAEHQIILFFGHIRQDKGLAILLKAFQEALTIEPKITLVIAGLPLQGDSAEFYLGLIQELGLGNNVACFFTYLENRDIPRFFLSADLVCLPYTSFFSQSGVLHLAQGFGRAVIVSRVGGLGEVVEDGRNGLVVAPGEVSSLREAILHLVRNPSLCQSMGKEALAISQTHYAWSGIAQKTKETAYGF